LSEESFVTEIPSINSDDFKPGDISDLPKIEGRLDHLPDKQRVAVTAEFQVQAWRLYVNGCTDFNVLSQKIGVANSTLRRWIKQDIARLNAERGDLTENYVEVELQRLDIILEMLMKDVSTKLIDVHTSEVVEGPRGGKTAVIKKITHLLNRVDLEVVDRILKIQSQREKLLGLNAPKQKETDGDKLFDLAELVEAALKLQKGEMPNEFIDADFTVEKEGKDGQEESKEEVKQADRPTTTDEKEGEEVVIIEEELSSTVEDIIKEWGELEEDIQREPDGNSEE
jgi:transposase-like protein